MNARQLAALCAAAMPEERLTADELARLCFGDGDEVLGDDRGAAVLHTQRFGDLVVGWLILVAVRPGEQGRGRGKQLVGDVIACAREQGVQQLLLASAVPRYVWPGVDLMNTRVGMLLETLGFERRWLGINMAIDTSFRHDPPGGVTVEREHGDGARDFCAHAYPHWVPELDVALANGTAFSARNAEGETIAFGCHSVNRAGWIGPMGTDPELQHGGVGSAVLAGLCRDLASRNCPVGEIAWVSNLRFYGKCGARVSRLFMGGKLEL